MIRHLVLVSLRNGDNWCVGMDSERFARETVLYAAVTWLRKCPQDRAGVWLLSRTGSTVVMDEKGVAEQTTLDPIAAFDPREVCAVRVVAQNVEDWSPDAPN